MKTIYTITIAIVAIAIIVGGAIAYMFLSQSNSPNSQATVKLNGAGATFPYPLLNAMITKYTTQVKTNVQINYQSIGSGGGISALKSKTVDFAASDAPLTASDMASAPNTLHIPETIGAVTIAYNLPGIPSGLHLTGKIIADIFQGTITTWNDPAIQSLNTNTTLPEKTITTIHRSDGSGTTFIFTGYLSLSSQQWNSTVGQGKSVAWPGGIGSNGNTGVASTVNGTQYAIGYVELAYALQNGMTVAAIQNPAGNWIQPSLSFDGISSPIRSRKRSTSRRRKLGERESSEHSRRKRLPNSELHLLACIQRTQRDSRNDARKSNSTSPIPMVRSTRRTTTRAQSRLRTIAIKRSPNRRSNHPINNLQRTKPTNKLKVA